jgi:hypothetical protein
MVMRPTTESELDQVLKYFHLTPRGGSPQVIVNDQTGEYSIFYADVSLRKDHDQIPIPLAEISHSFFAANMGLRTLQNSPRKVGGAFAVNHNQLSSLQGAPEHVGSYMVISHNPKLNSLEHLPSHIQGILHLDYTWDIPLLRTLVAQAGVDFGKWAPEPVIQILNKYAGGGKKVMLNCALELKKAGHAENARW